MSESTRSALEAAANVFYAAVVVAGVAGAVVLLRRSDPARRGLFLVDKRGVIRHVTVVGPIDAVATARELVELIRAHCPQAATGRRPSDRDRPITSPGAR